MIRKTFCAGLAVIVTFLASCSLPTPVNAQEHLVFGVYGTRNAFRASTVWLNLGAGWYGLVDFTVDPESNWITAPGHNFKTSDLVKVTSTQELPYPLTPHRTYYVCDVSPDGFRFANYGSGSCSSTTRVDFQNAGLGQLKVGKRVNSNHVLIDPVIDGLPPGVTSEIWCGTAAKCLNYSRAPGKVYSHAGSSNVLVKLRISATAALGPANLTLKLEPIGGNPQPIQIPIQIHDLIPVRLASASATAASSARPAIPGLAKWESTLKRLAPRWCKVSNPAEVMAFGVESQVWYYDGAYVYYQLADYLSDADWRACGANIARQYRDYVIANKGKIPAYRVFSRGLARTYQLTGDKTYLDAVRYLALEGLYSASGGTVRDDGIRENAYALDSMVSYEKLSGKRAPKLAVVAENLLGMFDQLFVSDTYVYQQLFMDGLAMRALIDYYGLTRDPRVPLAIKTALDWIWERAWMPQNRLMVNPDVLGPRCDWGCKAPNADLINLVAPAYAWYWSITGDTTYLTRGDAMFEHSLDSDITYSGKIFSQNYTWSFDYVRWRAGARPTR